MNTNRLYAVTLTGYFGLLILLVVWNGWLSPPESFPRALAILFFAGPLLFPLRGLLNGRPYTYAWTSYLALIYLTFGLVSVVSNPAERWLASTQVACSLALYVGTILYARFRSRELRS
jgi:uncharacterized membrane protein